MHPLVAVVSAALAKRLGLTAAQLARYVEALAPSCADATDADEPAPHGSLETVQGSGIDIVDDGWDVGECDPDPTTARRMGLRLPRRIGFR